MNGIFGRKEPEGYPVAHRHKIKGHAPFVGTIRQVQLWFLKHLIWEFKLEGESHILKVLTLDIFIFFFF